MATFTQHVQFFVERRNLPVEQLATLANLSRKTLYRWVNGEVTHPRHWYQIISLARALRLSGEEANQLLWASKNPSFHELKDLARYEYELQLLQEFSSTEPLSGLIPRPQPHFEPWTALEAPAGAVRPESPFYVERAADAQLRGQLALQGTTTTIQASRQTGKTSLLMQALHATRRASQARVIYLDFQLAGDATRASLESLLLFLSEAVAEQLDLPWDRVDAHWQASRSPVQTFNRFLQREVLQPLPHPVLLAIDEADLLLDAAYKKHFFALLRAWDSRRAFDPTWRKLNLVLVISTHPYLLIDDANLSPFNVGLTLSLKDFTPDQIADLNQRHGAPLRLQEIPALMRLVGGHPYLVRQAFYSLVSEGLTLPGLEAAATSPDGPFGKHLLFYHHSLKKNPPLLAAFQQVLREKPAPDEVLLDRLAAAGLLRQEEGKFTPRCGLYQQFFGRQSP